MKFVGSFFYIFFVHLILAVVAKKSIVLIIDGKNTEIESVPYQVSVEWYYRHICGGAIISKTAILTSASCAYGRDPKVLSVRLGSKTIQNDGEVKRISNLTTHPDYNGKHLDYDIAVLHVEEEIEYSPKIQPVTLPKRDQKEPLAGTETTVSGWGALELYEHASKTLRSSNLTIIDHDICKKAYAADTQITHNLICADGLRYLQLGNICVGDQGDPLVLVNSTILIGIASFSKMCGFILPGVFVSIPEFLPWIEKVLGLTQNVSVPFVTEI